jgi:hypothetical protein
MSRKHKIVTESTKIFDYQKKLLSEPSRKTGIPKARIYRHALDYYIVGFGSKIQKLEIEIPDKLLRKSTQDIEMLADIHTPSE